jgi:hypothetical protein
LIALSPGHTGAKLAPSIVRDAATPPFMAFMAFMAFLAFMAFMAFMAQLHFIIAGDDPKSCEPRLA